MELDEAAVGTVQRHRTALHRADMSRPIKLAFESALIDTATTVFDYGCGRGEDLRQLRALGIHCEGWDPAHFPSAAVEEADVVNLGYVINVIEHPQERAEALRRAWSLARKTLIVSARLRTEMSSAAWSRCNDGFLTQRATFQKFFEQQELREWIDSTLGVASIPAAPGVFYVFRDEAREQSYLASRFRRRAALPRISRVERTFEMHREALTPLMEFVAARGRLPEPNELADGALAIESALGSIKRAFGVVRQATGPAQWERISDERSQDLLVYLALARFTKRPTLQALPEVMQLDVRGLFGSYKEACAKADELLFAVGYQEQVSRACAASPIGKCTPEALYLHVDALQGAPPLIRVYEGCARAYVGAVDGGNILKLHRLKPQVSYLAYPEFETDPHPALRESFKVRFRGLHIEYRDYRESSNPFILHRKETFLPADSPLHTKFERLTRQETAKGLLDAHPNQIGTRDGWARLLRSRGVRLRGHQLVRLETQPSETDDLHSKR